MRWLTVIFFSAVLVLALVVLAGCTTVGEKHNPEHVKKANLVVKFIDWLWPTPTNNIPIYEQSELNPNSQ